MLGKSKAPNQLLTFRNFFGLELLLNKLLTIPHNSIPFINLLLEPFAFPIQFKFIAWLQRAGMNLIQLQAMMGHSSLEMTRNYIQMLDEDLIEAYRAHGPIDSFL